MEGRGIDWLFDGMWRCFLLDVKVKRSVDAGNDYSLVKAYIKIKLNKSRC